MAGPSKGPGDRDIVFGAVGIIAGKAAGPVIDSVVGQIAARSAVVEGLAVSQSAVPATPAATGAMTLWPAANEGVTVINGIKYVPHALERMQPLGTIIKDGALFSRGVPVSVVENAIQLGEVTPGRTAAEVVRTFENVRVITNPEGTRVITVIKIGR